MSHFYSPPSCFTARSSGSEAGLIAARQTPGSSRVLFPPSFICCAVHFFFRLIISAWVACAHCTKTLTLHVCMRQAERAHGHPQKAVLASNGGRGRRHRPHRGRIQRLLCVLHRQIHHRLPAHRLRAPTAARFLPARLPVRLGPRRSPLRAQR